MVPCGCVHAHVQLVSLYVCVLGSRLPGGIMCMPDWLQGLGPCLCASSYASDCSYSPCTSSAASQPPADSHAACACAAAAGASYSKQLLVLFSIKMQRFESLSGQKFFQLFMMALVTGRF